MNKPSPSMLNHSQYKKIKRLEARLAMVQEIMLEVLESSAYLPYKVRIRVCSFIESKK